MNETMGYALAAVIGLSSMVATGAMFFAPMGIALGLMTVEGSLATVLGGFGITAAAGLVLSRVEV